jgi:hypothetical protein
MAATHSQDTIDSVRQSLIEGATFGEIGSRLGVTGTSVNGIVARTYGWTVAAHCDIETDISQADPPECCRQISSRPERHARQIPSRIAG